MSLYKYIRDIGCPRIQMSEGAANVYKLHSMADEQLRYSISLYDKVCKRYGRPFYDRKVRPGHAFLPTKYNIHGMVDDLLHTQSMADGRFVLKVTTVGPIYCVIHVF